MSSHAPTRAALAALLVLAVSPAAHADDAGKVEEVVDVEEVEQVKPAAAPARAAGVKRLGRFHPLVVHFPIAWLVLLLLVDGATFLLGRPWHRAGRLLLLGATLSTLPAVVSGLLLADGGAPLAGEELARLLLHRNLAFAVAGVCLVATAVRLVRPEPLGGPRKLAYGLLLLGAVALVAVVGHLGGEMVFGPLLR